MWHFALLTLQGIEDLGNGIMLLGSEWFEFTQLFENTSVKEKNRAKQNHK